MSLAQLRPYACATSAVALLQSSLLAETALAMQPERLEVIAERISDCFIERRPEPSRRWLGTLPGSRAESVIIRNYSWGFNICLNIARVDDVWGYQANEQTSRERVAAAVLRADFPTIPAALPATVPAGSWLIRELASLGARSPVNRTAVQTLMLGDCLARSQWRSVTGLVRSARGSEAERAAVNELRPHLAGCIPAGLTMRIDPPRLRSLLAEPVYHILLDAPADLSSGQEQPHA